MSKKLKYSSVDHHLEEKVFLLLPFSWWSVHSILQSGENPWSNSGHWAFHGTTYIYQPLTVLVFFHIRPLSKVHPNITCKAASSTAICLILSKFDYCNGLLSGLPQKQIKHLQAMQNAAARTHEMQKTKKLKTYYSTPILRQLHWLLIQKRICHKIISATYQSVHDNNPPLPLWSSP